MTSVDAAIDGSQSLMSVYMAYTNGLSACASAMTIRFSDVICLFLVAKHIAPTASVGPSNCQVAITTLIDRPVCDGCRSIFVVRVCAANL